MGHGLSHAMASPLKAVVFKVSARPVIILAGVAYNSLSLTGFSLDDYLKKNLVCTSILVLRCNPWSVSGN